MSDAANERLAVYGGRPTVTQSAPRWPYVDQAMENLLVKVFRDQPHSQVWPNDQIVGQFEKAFAEYHGVRHCLGCSSGTQALIMAVILSGVGVGDEVIVTPYTFGASIGCVLAQGGIPVFVDISSDALTMDPEKVEAAITLATKAIVPVHIYGQPADMDPLMEIAERHNLTVIEDCAQSHGARYKGRLTGTLGHFGCFSFQGTKVLQGGEGGALIFDDDDTYDEAVMRFTHPFRQEAEVRDPERRRLKDCVTVYSRLHPFAAAILMAQLPHLDKWVSNRRANTERFYKGLAEIPGVHVPNLPSNCQPAFYAIPLRYVVKELGGLDRSVFIGAARAEGVPLRVYVDVPYHLRPMLRERKFAPKGFPWTSHLATRDVRYAPGDCPVCEFYCEKEELMMMMPLHERAETFVDQLLEGLAKLADHADELRRKGLPS